MADSAASAASSRPGAPTGDARGAVRIPYPKDSGGRVLPWDAPVEGEKPEHFALFEGWRDLGPERTLKGKDTMEMVARVAGRSLSDRWIRKIAAEWYWQARARSYDAYMEQIRVSSGGGQSTVVGEVEGYRERQARLARALLEATIRLVTLANQRLATLKPAELRPADVSRFFEVSIKVAASASSAEAQAIGLKELLTILEEQDARSGWETKGGGALGSAPRGEA